jgi:hypothetical protein
MHGEFVASGRAHHEHLRVVDHGNIRGGAPAGEVLRNALDQSASYRASRGDIGHSMEGLFDCAIEEGVNLSDAKGFSLSGKFIYLRVYIHLLQSCLYPIK